MRVSNGFSILLSQLLLLVSKAIMEEKKKLAFMEMMDFMKLAVWLKKRSFTKQFSKS